jgi:heme a synthase
VVLASLKDRLSSRIRGLAVAAVVANVGIAITGSVVRVTGSGLGCSEWPGCVPGSMVPVEHPELSSLHQWIEYGNRLLGVLVGVIGALCFLAVWSTRPRRKRVLVLSAVMMGGVVAQAVIGGITVMTGLLWWTVAIHFTVSPILTWFAVLLVRSLREGDEPAKPRVHRSVRPMLIVSTVTLVLLMIAGTLVTAAGPHAGDKNVARLNLPIETLARVHSAVLYVFLGLIVVIGVILRRSRPVDPTVWRRYLLLVAAVLAQGSVGFVQYFNGVPSVLVVTHVFGAMMVTVALAGLWCAGRDRGPVPADVPVERSEQFATASPR